MPANNRRRVPQDVGYVLERRTAPQKFSRQGMAESMSMGFLHTGCLEDCTQASINVGLVRLGLAGPVPEKVFRFSVAQRRRHGIERGLHRRRNREGHRLPAFLRAQEYPPSFGVSGDTVSRQHRHIPYSERSITKREDHRAGSQPLIRLLSNPFASL